jgi:hypothetical protein
MLAKLLWVLIMTPAPSYQLLACLPEVILQPGLILSVARTPESQTPSALRLELLSMAPSKSTTLSHVKTLILVTKQTSKYAYHTKCLLLSMRAP